MGSTVTFPTEDSLLSAYRKIGAALLSSLDLDKVLDILAEEIINAGVFRSLMVALVARDRREIVVVRGLTRYHGRSLGNGTPDIDWKRMNKRYDWHAENILALVARTGTMQVIEGWDERFGADVKGLESFEDRVSYFIPVSNERGTLAVLATGSTVSDRGDVVRSIKAMQPLLDQAAIAIGHAEVHTQLQQEMAERQASEEKYRSLFENMQSGFALHDMIYDDNGVPIDYVFLDLNDAFESIIDLRKDQVVGRRVTEIMAPFGEDPHKWIHTFGEVARTGVSISVEYYSESARRHYAVNAYRSKPGQFAMVITDISDRKRLDEEKRKSRNLQSLGILAGGMAHEFNNMLTGVIGGLSFLREGFAEGSTEYEIAKIAEDSARKSCDLTRQLITFAKGGTPVKKPVDLTGPIRKTVLASTASSTAEPVFRFPETGTTAKVDEKQLTQIIDNLARNAVEAMPGGGLLTVEIERVQVGPDETPPLEQGSYFRISFTDQGTGIPDESIGKIFDPYFSTKPMAQGLGLSISHSIARRHDGTITVHSHIGSGTTLRVYLPARTD